MVSVSMIIPEILKASAEAAVSGVYPECVGEMFTCPLSLTGQEPVTHWGACPVVDSNVLISIEAMAANEPFASMALLRSCEPVNAAATFRELLNATGLHHVSQE